MVNKLTVQMVNINNNYGNSFHLPISAGMLVSYSKSMPFINENVVFHPIVFDGSPKQQLSDKVFSADIIAISCYIWSWNQSMALAREAKKRNPKCTIIVGGPHVPNRVGDFFDRHPYIDIACHGEGEIAFAEILAALMKNESLENIAGLSYQDTDSGNVVTTHTRERVADLDKIPSPFLTGVFDDIMSANSDIRWSVTWETNRGCPYGCTFCEWGSNTLSKVKQFGIERLRQDIEWFADHKISWVFCADANFGILKRDQQIAEFLVETKRKKGYPVDFRVAFAKNANERVLSVGNTLSEANLLQGLSLDLQSMDEGVLENIKRKNLKIETLKKLHNNSDSDTQMTSNLIIGLPGESYESFSSGLSQMVGIGKHLSLYVISCSVLPNSPMAEPEYMEKFGIKTIESPLFLAHSTPKSVDTIQEFEQVIIETNTMNREMYKKSYIFALTVLCFHSSGVLQSIALLFNGMYGMSYKQFYEFLIEFGREHPSSVLGGEIYFYDHCVSGLLNGEGLTQVIPHASDISWYPEEASFIRISERFEDFFEQIDKFLLTLCSENNININSDFLRDVVSYQKNILANHSDFEENILETKWNIHEYISSVREGNLEDLREEPCAYVVRPHVQTMGDLRKFAHEVVLSGRKKGYYHKIVKTVEKVVSF